MESTAASRVTPLREIDVEPIRLPPSNTEAEQALLGAIFRNNLAHSRVADFLEPEHFSNAVHGRIYAAIGKLIERGQLANPVTLKNLFDQDCALAEIGGAQYLTRLAESAVTIINAEEYGRRIHDLHLRRQLIGLGEDVVNDAFRHDFDDDAVNQIERAAARLHELVENGSPQPLRATPFQWTDAADILPRQWLYGRHLIRGFASATVGASGFGKSSQIIADAMAMVTGRPLFGDEPAASLRVWHYNLEDPRDELCRRIAAAAKHYGLGADDIGDRLFVNSGRDAEMVIAKESRDGIEIVAPVVRAIMKAIKVNRIDVLQVDPFVATHRVSENDNAKIDAAARQWVRIAEETGCAIELVHHVRKNSGTEQLTVDDARGASSLIAAVRSARVLNRMAQDEGEKAGVDDHRLYFRVDNGKSNLAPPMAATWRRFVSVSLDNGPTPDFVGVVEAWKWPDPFDGVTTADLMAVQKRISDGQWRESDKATDWAGRAVAEVLGLDPSDKAVRASVRRMIKTWVSTGALRVVERQDKERHKRPYIEVGQWATLS